MGADLGYIGSYTSELGALCSRGSVPVTVEFTGAVLDGKFVDAKGIVALEKLPTKKDLITMIACGIKQVPTKLARATKGVPSDLAYGVKAIADGKSDVIQA